LATSISGVESGKGENICKLVTRLDGFSFSSVSKVGGRQNLTHKVN